MSGTAKKPQSKYRSNSESPTSNRSKSRSPSKTGSDSYSSSRSTSKGSTTRRSKNRSSRGSKSGGSSTSGGSQSRRYSKNSSRSGSSEGSRSRSRSRSSSSESSLRSKSTGRSEVKNKRDPSERKNNINKSENDRTVSGVSQGSVARWRKSEPKYEPRYPMYGLNPMKMEGARRDTTNYYIHRRKVAEVKSRVDNRPPTIYPHVYCNMKKLKRQQEEQALIERNNQFLLSKLYVAATTTRVDNKYRGRNVQTLDRQRNQKRWEELRQTSSQLASRQVSTNQSRHRSTSNRNLEYD